MDLVAIVGENSKNFFVQRLDIQAEKKSNWERLCSINTSSVISAIAWHPDGMIFECYCNLRVRDRNNSLAISNIFLHFRRFIFERLLKY